MDFAKDELIQCGNFLNDVIHRCLGQFVSLLCLQDPGIQMTSPVYNCPLYSEFQSPSYSLLLLHIRMVHSNKPGFSITCSLDGCQRTFINMKTYTNHVYGYHLISQTPPTLIPVTENYSTITFLGCSHQGYKSSNRENSK